MRVAEPIAIVGIGCRFPGKADSSKQFWEVLREGVDVIREVPADRWNADALFDPDARKPGKISAKWGGFVDDVDKFDAAFFGISPREATRVDPQQRLLMESAWWALEDAGTDTASLAGSSVGVFVGLSSQDYYNIQSAPSEHDFIDAHTATGGAMSIAANRLSYFFDFRGPSMVIDTACSSSLVAVHLACRSMRNGDCDMALAGGTNAILAPAFAIALSQLAMLSPEGHCRAFDARANGYVRAEGAGIVFLKRLSRAVKDHDRIYAILRGTAVNQDGRTPGITVPSQQSQEAVARDACRDAGVAPAAIGYVEAHGTGTPVGDPIEARALGAVYGQSRSVQTPCFVGSVKSNIGHLESAAGIAGLIKAILTLYHCSIPASLHFETPNPAISFDTLRLRVPTALHPWPRGTDPRLASVNAFGFGGTNAHVVLQEAPTDAAALDADDENRTHVLAISARSRAALDQLIEQYSHLLKSTDGPPLRDVCYTAGHRRTHHDHRLAACGSSKVGLSTCLDAYQAGVNASGVVIGRVRDDRPPRIAFVFCGQGAQWWGMARVLLQSNAVFRTAVSEMDAALSRHSRWSVLDELLKDEKHSRISQTDILQPAVCTIQIALARLWQTWGVEPAAVVGHSMGEVAAAHVAGVLSLDDAARVIVCRSRIQSRATGTGKMLVVGLPVAQAHAITAKYYGRLWIACLNGPSSTTLAGESDAVAAVHMQLEGDGVFARIVQVNCACHTEHMEPYRDELLKTLTGLRCQKPAIPLYSTVDGTLASSGQMEARYWWRNFREPVRFHDALQTMMQDGYNCYIELGPHPVLASSIAETAAMLQCSVMTLPSLRRGADDHTVLRSSVAMLYTQGQRLHWDTLEPGRFTTAPLYPWQREHYWQESARSIRTRLRPAVHPLLGSREHAPTPTWTRSLDLRMLTWLADHKVTGSVVMPGAAYIAEAIEAMHLIAADAGAAVIRDVEFMKPLVLSESEPRTARFELGSDHAWAMFSGNEEGWVRHAQGRASRESVNPRVGDDLDAIASRCTHEIDRSAFLRDMESRGIRLGPAFQGVSRLFRGNGEGFAWIDTPEPLSADVMRYYIHPAILDACFQVVFAVFPMRHSGLYLPVRLQRVRLFSSAPSRTYVHVRAVREEPTWVEFDLIFWNEAGRVFADAQGLRCQRINEGEKARLEHGLYEWRWKLRSLPGALSRSVIYALDVAEIVERRVRPTIAALEHETGWADYYDRVEPRFLPLCIAYATNALIALGWTPASGNAGVVPQHHRVFERLLDIVAAGGSIVRDGESWQMRRPLEPIDTDVLVRALRSEFPQYRAELTLLSRCGTDLARVLRGQMDVLKLLFPPEDLETATHLYAEAPVSILYNRLARSVIEAVVAELPSGTIMRALEIGAGTGGLTSHMLRALPQEGTEYVFTDVSLHFTQTAERTFADHPGFRTALLDIEDDPASQGLETGGFDLVLASNVLHVTCDLRTVLTHAHQLLAPGGVLLCLELTRQTPILDLIFGLTEGWWRFADHDLRPAYPLLDQRAWLQLLHDTGFVATAIADDPGETQSLQSVVVAQKSSQSQTTSLLPQSTPPGNWLLVGPTIPLIQQLKVAFEGRGLQCSVAAHVCDAGLRTAIEAITPLCGVLYLTDVEHDPSYSIIRLVQTIKAVGAITPPRLIIVTTHAEHVPGDTTPVNVRHAPVWGVARVLLLEHPELRCRVVDLPERVTPADVDALVREALSNESDEEITLRSKARYVHRLTPITLADSGSQARCEPERSQYKLQVEKPGVLNALRFVRTDRRHPAVGEVEIEVCAAGLNFRDVMIAMGMLDLSAMDIALGSECSGRITAVGDRVTSFAVGDEVIALAPECFTPFVTVCVERVVHKPRALTMAEGATLLGAFLAALYALDYKAHLQRGERVLIHSAAGGVGLAAVQIAQSIGAEIFATVGTDEKREYLRSLGVNHVMDSRSLLFADQVWEATNGQGVDVVLNSLAGEAIPYSLALLRRYGRFIEIGKRDIFGDSRIGLRPFARDLSFIAVDLYRVCQEQPAVMVEMLRKVVKGVDTGAFRPMPYKIFPVAEATAAFRYMAQGKHIGKIVLGFEGYPAPMVHTPRTLAASAQGTYLIAGGVRGFGLATAQWLVERGARSLVLIGRSVALPLEARTVVQALEHQGVTVVVAVADIANDADVRGLVDRITQEMPPLRGVIQSAHVQDSVLIQQLDEDRWHAVLAPKMRGTWNLHLATLHCKLDFFVMFSSVASLYGGFGQANYAAGNAFQDALAHHRRLAGLPALTVNWGWVGDVGFVARHEEVGRLVESQGLVSFTAREGLEVLERLMLQQRVQVGVMLVDWPRWAANNPLPAASPRFSYLSTEAGITGSVRRDASFNTPGVMLLDANPDERYRIACFQLRKRVASVLGTPETSIEMGASLSSLGFDSLMAVELMNRIDLDFGVEVPVMQLLQGPSIERLASSILDALQMAVGESQAVPETAMLQHGGAAQPSHQILQDVPDALTLSQRAVQILLRSALRLVARIEVQGLEHIPHKGTVLLAGNHVNQFDALLLFAFAPRRVTAFAAAYLETRRWKGWFMSRMLNAIYVVRGESDQTAIATAIEVLRGGGVVAIAPEGTRSGTGVLGRAHTGVAYLSGASLAPVVPVVAYGQEGAITYWRSLRRVPIFVAVGRPVQAHDGPVTGAALEGYTARVMRQIASLLPPAYRGMWSD